MLNHVPRLAPLAERLREALMASRTFGWILQPGAGGPQPAARLLEDNRRFLTLLDGHFDTFWIEDHFQWGTAPTLEAWTSLTWQAARFPTYRCGTMVLGQSYRNPALLAKAAATLQWLAGGRLILGIGAGWKEDEYRAYNFPFPAAATRIHELREAATIIKTMWSTSPATYAGTHYRITAAFCEPRPTPPPPLMIGGGGEKLTLRVVAELADWWNLGFVPFSEYERKWQRLAEHCAAVGRDPATIKKTYFALVSISNDPSRILRREGLHIVGGNPAQVADELAQFVASGVEHFQIRFLDFPDPAGAELFIQTVVPQLSGRQGPGQAHASDNPALSYSSASNSISETTG